MNVYHFIAVGVLSVVVNSDAGAQSTPPMSLHDIPWYVAHDRARVATLNLCRSDHRFSRDVDCANAETAATAEWANRTGRGTPARRGSSRVMTLDEMLTSPTYYVENRLARVGTLASCRSARPPPADECAAARQGEAMDPRGRQ